jgi:hypothetical protein
MTTGYKVGGIDLSNVLCPFVDISGGLGKISSTTNYQVGGIDLSNTYTSFVTYGSKGVIDTGYDVSGSDLATIFQPIITYSTFYTISDTSSENNIYGLTSDTSGYIYFYNNYGTNMRIVQLNGSGQTTGWVCASNNDVSINSATGGIYSITYNSGYIYYATGSNNETPPNTRFISRINATITPTTNAKNICNCKTIYNLPILLNFDSSNNLYFVAGDGPGNGLRIYIYYISSSAIATADASNIPIDVSNTSYLIRSPDTTTAIKAMCIDSNNKLYITSSLSGLTIYTYSLPLVKDASSSLFFNYTGTTIGTVNSMICKNNILYISYSNKLAAIDTTKTIDGSYNLIYLKDYSAYDNVVTSTFDISNNLYLAAVPSYRSISKFIW